MTGQFPLLGDIRKPEITVAISFGVLLLLPTSLGFGNLGKIIMQEAFAQFNLPLLEEEDTDTTTTPSTTITTSPAIATNETTQQDLSTYLLNPVNRDALRGLIGSTLPAQSAAGTTALTADDNDSGHIATGRFRLFANETLVRRFITEINVAAIDGTSFHNITIEQDAPHRFPTTQINGSTSAPEATSSAALLGRIYLDGSSIPVISNVPMTLTIRGQVLAVENIDIDETRIADAGQRDALSAIDGQSVYGTIT